MIGERTATLSPGDPSRAAGASSDVVGAEPAPRPPRSRRVRRRTIALALVLLLLVPAFSYVQALTYPGSATWQMRSVEWVRDHGGSPLVDRIENWYYTANRPPGSASGAAAPQVVVAANAPGGRSPLVSRARLLAGQPPVLGQNTWVPGRRDPSGAPAIYTSFFRPDPQYPSVVAGVAWIRARDTGAHLVAGTREPGGNGWPGGARVAPGDVATLVATFNSGWKMTDTHGGFYLAGQSAGRLLHGQASLVIDSWGAATVGQWGRDVTMNPQVVAVRQNLALIVDNGLPVAGLDSNLGRRWGSFENQHQYTWRSGVGVDAAGDLIYVAGANLTLQTLAAALADTGVVRGMELDVHSALVSFASWVPSSTGSVVPTKLLPEMNRPADRYLAADQRDFFYLTLR
jgi:hypothetical protein